IVDIKEGKGRLPIEMLKALADKVQPLGWHLEFLMHVDEFPDLDQVLDGFPVDVVFGHLGYMKTSLGLSAPGYRLQKTIERSRNFETAVCAGRLEGWTTRKLDALAAREIRSVPYEEFKKLQDMSRDDLAFFAIPAAGLGTATYKGPSEVDGRKTLAVEYAYASGFRLTRHFDAETFALVASDQPTPKGELQRQKVEALTMVDGIAFPSKETIIVDGKKSGEVSYDRIQLNPELPAGLFDFPSF
ncbi:MAG: hypothetical protein EBR83_10285, partial [Verrucomicrobia bacterium]|nr:hypothetical protein [Verrucomicrobiota bacterium]